MHPKLIFVTEFCIRSLKFEVQFWHAKALKSNEENDAQGCKSAIMKEMAAYQTLTKMLAAYNYLQK